MRITDREHVVLTVQSARQCLQPTEPELLDYLPLFLFGICLIRPRYPMSTGEDATGTGAATAGAGESAFSAEQLALIDQIVAARVAASTDPPPVTSASDTPASSPTTSGK